MIDNKTSVFVPTFGAIAGEREVTFRTWAPAQDKVWLVLDDGPEIAMTRDADGFFTTRVERVRPGQRYWFRLKQGLRLVRALARWGWLLPLSTLGLIAAVVARSWPQLLRWWGVPLAGAGGTGLLLLIGAGSLAQRLTQRAMAQAQLPEFMEQALLGVGDRLRDDILGALLFESILLLLAGAALWGIGAYLGRRRP